MKELLTYCRQIKKDSGTDTHNRQMKPGREKERMERDMKRLIRKNKNNILVGLAFVAFLVMVIAGRGLSSMDKQRTVMFVTAAVYLLLFILANMDCLWGKEESE